jgi:exonuclease I
VNEVNTAIANVSFYQAQNNNHIFVNLDENLAHLVTLESELFQAMLTTICQKMFTEQHMSVLDIDLNVIDVNSAQQIVRISFTIKKASQLQPLQETINTLAFNEEANESLNNITDNYLKDL